MTRFSFRLAKLAGAAAVALSAALGSGAALAEELNLYSSRHYDTDERLYEAFTEKTGIKINRIEDKADVLIARMKAEGRNSPADVLLTVDAGRLWRAEQEGLLQSVESDVLENAIPSYLRHPEGKWFGFSKRARVIFIDKDAVDASEITTYEDLADPRWKGKVCTRSSSNIYMLSLMAAMIDHLGADDAKAWAQGMWDNRAREPQGGDTDQLRGIVSGECDIVLSNTYYYARAIGSEVRGLEHPEQTSQIAVIFPNQGENGRGAHVNISGGGVAANAPNRENAVKFLEYLASAEAQKYFADGNNEYPVIEGVEPTSAVQSLGTFTEDDLPLDVLGENQAEAQRLYDEIGYK